MKKVLILLLLINSPCLFAQPCKFVKPGMTSEEVIKLVGEPTEINNLGSEKDTKATMVVWQYGAPSEEGNQRVEFRNDKVVEVIPDGNLYDQLTLAVSRGAITVDEFKKQVEALKAEGCK